MQPEKAIKTPIIFCQDVMVLKNNAPVMITKIGVSALSIPASELSIPVSAIQNKYAGNKLPKAPERKTRGILLNGIILKLL